MLQNRQQTQYEANVN